MQHGTYLPNSIDYTLYSKITPIHIFIPHVNFQQSDWSIGRVTILNVTRQCLTAVKFVVKMGILYNKINIMLHSLRGDMVDCHPSESIVNLGSASVDNVKNVIFI